jgi:hypothetical protein
MRIWADAPILNELSATTRDLVLVPDTQSGSAEASALNTQKSSLRDRIKATAAIFIAEMIEDM